ncbi:GNAT family N-acetyltransferase [Leucobacter sp. G161]|uniref:GNAT family N-acetyltransferase n=1 Tax=Leucobacter sp. G161 TaxID=663704 RepID=UPI00073BA740|nr:GNAT family protein [Leucobacter sp. G161]KUF06298.1 GCN5 family acetyltransferase [Leucobacter sp. G161]
MFTDAAGELPSTLSAGRIGIRLIRRRDARVLERLLRENREWLSPWEATYPGVPGPNPGDVSLKPAIKRMRQQHAEGRGVPFVITYDEEVVGQLSASDLSRGALWSASIGYWIAGGHAGRGITPTAVALAIDYLFVSIGLHRVEICIRPENAASLRIVEKLGMRYEGRRLRYIHIDGAWRDHDSFAVTREEVQGSMLGRLERLAG